MMINKDGCTCLDETTRMCNIHGPWRCIKCGGLMYREDFATTSFTPNHKFCSAGGRCFNYKEY